MIKENTLEINGKKKKLFSTQKSTFCKSIPSGMKTKLRHSQMKGK